MSKVTFKKNNLQFAVITMLLFLLIIATFVWLLSCSLYSSHESVCHAHVYQLGFSVMGYHDYKHHLPSFKEFKNHLPVFTDVEGNPTFSWRIILLQEFKEFNELRLEESWKSEHNLPIIQSLESRFPVDKWFGCSFTYPQEKQAAFVALTGKGTAWTEIHEGRKTPQECGDMILIFETPNPKNHWAEPGDDVAPEKVVEIFIAYKNQKRTFFPPKKHFPNRFYTAWNGSGTFDDIENVEDLKRKLVIQED